MWMRNWPVRFSRCYLVYLVNQGVESRRLKTKDFVYQKTAPWTPKFFIYN